jgi:hypothetical protein
MRRALLLVVLCVASMVSAPVAAAQDPASTGDRVEELQQELDSLIEEVDDLREPVAEFELFDECMYLIGVTRYGKADGTLGYHFGAAGRARRPALALALGGFRRPMYQFLGFPAEEPPSIECNEDATQESTDD